MTAEHNRELELAWEYVEHTGVSIFLTGKAGTGKTTFLRTLREKSTKSMVVVAPTGVAAINAGGVTIHSFFQLPTSPYVPGSEYRDKFSFSRDKLRILRALDLLVIDEISMVRADLLDAIDNALRKYRRSSKPFGGVQLLMIGDLQQLAPVVTQQDEVLLRPHYTTPYFFGSKALAQIQYITIELTKVYRQQNQRFVELLNHIRENRLTYEDSELLNTRLDPSFRPDTGSDFIRLTSHNFMADEYNNSELESLDTPRFTYTAHVKGNFPELSYPTALQLTLKKGAQVMFIKNDSSGEHLYYNGKIGHVTRIANGVVEVQCPGDNEPIAVTPQVWENAKYTINETSNKIETEIQGTFSQIPLRLAWAITIHKSQGLTFDHVIIDAEASFASGQVYVALSRCKTLEGIVLASPISRASLGIDPTVENYIVQQEVEAARSIDRLPSIKQEYYRSLLLELFNFSDITNPQTSLSRLLTQTFRHSYPAETDTQQQIGIKLKDSVIEVADKWITMLASTPYDTLRCDAIQTRVCNSAIYFSKQLKSIFSDSLKRAAYVKTDNKKASQRIGELVTELQQLLKQRIYILDSVAEEGFSISSYLQTKARASLDASRNQRASRLSKSSGSTLAQYANKRLKPLSAPKLKEPKEPKQLSHETSYQMFLNGMTRNEIAKERKMVPSTVTSHLMRYVDEGKLELRDILTPVTYNTIVDAINSTPRTADGRINFEGIKARLASDISIWDIKLVAARLNKL